jgi:hypothetical protein
MKAKLVKIDFGLPVWRVCICPVNNASIRFINRVVLRDPHCLIHNRGKRKGIGKYIEMIDVGMRQKHYPRLLKTFGIYW